MIQDNQDFLPNNLISLKKVRDEAFAAGRQSMRAEILKKVEEISQKCGGNCPCLQDVEASLTEDTSSR